MSFPTSLPGLKSAPPLNPCPRHRHDDALLGSPWKVNGEQSPGYVGGTEYSVTIRCLFPSNLHNQFSTTIQPTSTTQLQQFIHQNHSSNLVALSSLLLNLSSTHIS